MAAADFAFAASAGAIALALSTTLWSWRFRRRCEAAVSGLHARLVAAEIAAGEAEAAASVFDGVLVAVDGREARLIVGEDALPALADLLEAKADDAVGLIEALAATHPDHARRFDALMTSGEPFRFLVQRPTGAIVVEGRPSGGLAWIRAALAREAPSGGRFAGLADRLPGPAWIIDASGALVWANRAWLEAAETPSIERAVADDKAFDRGADALLTDAQRLKSRREGFRWVTVKGQRRAYRVIAEPLEEGETLAFAVDVTEAEETRELLKRHASAHGETLNHLADGVAIFGPERRLTYHNTAFQTLWKLDPAWLAERPTHGELLDRLRQKRLLPETADYAKFKGRELDFYGSTEVAPDDLWTLPDARTLRIVRQPHPLGGLLLIFSDITDELKLRAEYNALIQVQRATLDKLNDAVAVFGSDGRLRFHNEAFESLWGLHAAQLQDAGDFDGVIGLCRPLVHDANFWSELKARATDPDPQARVHLASEVKTSDRRTFAYQSCPLPDGATLVAFGDVTARHALESALDQRSQALAETEKLKREFVGNVSYELRTPLTTILGYTELMEAEGSALPDRARGYLASVRNAGAQLARSIDDVLDMAEMDAGEMALALEETPVAEALAEAVERMTPLLASRQSQLVLACDPSAGLMRADGRRLAQILDHLIENAARACQAGGVVTVAADRAAGAVRIRVSDTGRGIPYHQQAHVFDRFVGRDRGGPGLGLALVKALVELHGGWIELESEPGAGATFTVHLPEAQAARGDVAAEPLTQAV
jgi:nitrogen-specific signal transduction histidine kinase